MDNSPFAKLSPELRNQIYHYALLSDRSFEIRLERRSYQSWIHPTTAKPSDHPHPTALMETCRAIRAESTLLFYHDNSFTVNQYVWERDSCIDNFLNTRGRKELDALRHVKVAIWTTDNAGPRRLVRAYKSARRLASECTGCTVSVQVTRQCSGFCETKDDHDIIFSLDAIMKDESDAWATAADSIGWDSREKGYEHEVATYCMLRDISEDPTLWIGGRV